MIAVKCDLLLPFIMCFYSRGFTSVTWPASPIKFLKMCIPLSISVFLYNKGKHSPFMQIWWGGLNGVGKDFAFDANEMP